MIEKFYLVPVKSVLGSSILYYSGFWLWMNGYRLKKVYRHYFTILYDFFLRPSWHLPAQG